MAIALLAITVATTLPRRNHLARDKRAEQFGHEVSVDGTKPLHSTQVIKLFMGCIPLLSLPVSKQVSYQFIEWVFLRTYWTFFILGKRNHDFNVG